jgi:hypothetical protein
MRTSPVVLLGAAPLSSVSKLAEKSAGWDTKFLLEILQLK